MEYKGDVLAAVTIERDLNRYLTVREINNSYAIWFALLGGMVVGLYILFYALEFFLTYKSFQNYMASELYYIPEEVEDPLGIKQPEPKGCCASRPTDGLTTTRSVSRDFHNEIIPEDGRVLNSSRVASWCKIFRLCTCCCKRRRIERIFMKARVFNAQELNITSIIKSQRESQAALELLRNKLGYYEAEAVINSKVKRAVRMSDDEGAAAMDEKMSYANSSARDMNARNPPVQQFVAVNKSENMGIAGPDAAQQVSDGKRT